MINVYYTATGEVVIEAGEMELWISRAEAEALFVDIGHVLQDMDTVADNFSEDKGEQPDV